MIRNRIAVKLGLTIMGLFMVVLIPLGYVVNSIFTDFYSERLEREMMHLSNSYADMMGMAGEMSIGMIGMMAKTNGVDVIIFDQNGTVIAETDYNQPPTINQLTTEDIGQLLIKESISKKITNKNGEFYFATISPISREVFDGALGVLSPIQSALDSAKQIQSLLILAGTGAIFMAIGITYIVSKRLSQPLLQMEDAARRMAKGDLDVKVDVITNDETGSLARTINELGEELKRYRETRSEFFANISHELRTPITYLEGYSQVLADGLIESEEDKSKYLQIIQQEARRMKILVEDLFELSKMEEGRLSIHTEWMNLSEALLHVLNKIRPRILDKGLIFEQHILPDAPFILGDGNRIEQIFFNLLDNAVRYTAQGTIKVTMYIDGLYLATEISDTGLGIPNEELPYVFERFYRVEKSRSREFGGTGLGLAIVKRLMELHEGQIEISSEINRGTTFIIRFPIAREVVS